MSAVQYNVGWKTRPYLRLLKLLYHNQDESRLNMFSSPFWGTFHGKWLGLAHLQTSYNDFMFYENLQPWYRMTRNA